MLAELRIWLQEENDELRYLMMGFRFFCGNNRWVVVNFVRPELSGFA